MIFSIKQQLKGFSAAHRLLSEYKGECNNLHGHNYAVEVTIGADKLDNRGFVVDFNEVKNLCDPWIKENLDHSVIVNENDNGLLGFVKNSKQKHYVISVNSSVENLVKMVFEKLNQIIEEHSLKQGKKIRLISVQIWETQNSSAVYEKNSGRGNS